MEPIADLVPIRWKVTARKSYFWGHKIMKPGQIFTAARKDIPPALMVMIEPLDNTIQVEVPPKISRAHVYGKQTENKPEPEEKVVPVPALYRAVERKDGLYWDVVDTHGKKLNEKKLTKEESVAMVKELMS